MACCVVDVVPCCSPNEAFSYSIEYNTVCTVCNVLFIFILNKHKFLTRYVFYINICMICTYFESNIIAVVYFVGNSEGSLANLKLTALRTAAISLILILLCTSFENLSTHGNRCLRDLEKNKQKPDFY